MEETKKRQPKKLPKIISREDAKKILDSCNIKCFTGLRARVMFHLMYRCGLRVSEIHRLRLADVFLNDGFIYIQQSKNKTDRVVPIDKETIDWLHLWMEKRKESEFLFMSTNGKKMDNSEVRKILYGYSERAGVYIQDVDQKKKVKPHCLRHCFATELLEDGANIVQVKELLGHQRIDTTMVYQSVRPELLRNMVQGRTPIGGLPK